MAEPDIVTQIQKYRKQYDRFPSLNYDNVQIWGHSLEKNMFKSGYTLTFKVPKDSPQPNGLRHKRFEDPYRIYDEYTDDFWSHISIMRGGGSRIKKSSKTKAKRHHRRGRTLKIKAKTGR